MYFLCDIIYPLSEAVVGETLKMLGKSLKTALDLKVHFMGNLYSFTLRP